MGNGMNKILTGIYVGNFRDAKDEEQLRENKITHILSIHDNAKPLVKDKEYLCIHASDTPDQPLTQFFPQCIYFIHKARRQNGHVLIHCLAGVSRSVTVTAAYIMTATTLGWRDALNVIRAARNVANPNFGFQKQLQDYECEGLEVARRELAANYPGNMFDDARECEAALKCFRHFVQTGERTSPNDYPLPYKAYGERQRSARGTRDAREKETQSCNRETKTGEGKGSAYDKEAKTGKEKGSGKVEDSESKDKTADKDVNGDEDVAREKVQQKVEESSGSPAEHSVDVSESQITTESSRTPT